MHDKILFSRLAITPHELYKLSLTPTNTPPFGAPKRNTTVLETYRIIPHVAFFTDNNLEEENKVEIVAEISRTTYLTAVTVHPKLNRTARPIVPSITLNRTRTIFKTSDSWNTLPPLTRIVRPRCRMTG